MDLTLLRRLDAYLDAAPRTATAVERVGPFHLFVTRGGGWPYYARPAPGAGPFSVADVHAVLERQRTLGVPEALEWVDELAPGLASAAAGAGLAVLHHPLMHLTRDGFRPAPPPAGARVRIVSSDDDLAWAHAVAMVAFANPGTEVGPAGDEALPEIVAGLAPAMLEYTVDRVARGQTVTAVVEVHRRPVAVGSHVPVGEATEVVGVGTLPTCRRRGYGAAVTSTLVRDAHRRGIGDVLLSAGDEAVARMYERLGFRVVGTAGAASRVPRSD